MPETHWLDENEARAWRGYLTMRRALERGADRQLTQESGLSAADYQLLVPLSEAPDGAIRARDLGRVVEWERSRLSHQIRRMEQRGLIARSDCPTDARGTIIVLTETGRRAIEAAAPAHVRWVRENFVDLLSRDELETLGAICLRVIEHLRSAGAECDLAEACDESGPCDETATCDDEAASAECDGTPEGALTLAD